MQASRIRELLDPFLGPPDARRLTPEALELISTYIDILQRWNARINLTAIRDEEEIVTRHFGESLFAARHLFPGAGQDRQGFGGAPGRETDRASAPEVDAASATAPVPERHIPPSFSPQPFSPQPSSPQPSSPQPMTIAGKGPGRTMLEDRVEGADQTGAVAPVVADVGSGAGFPGIPIKLWAPEISLTLIESSHKKATFLRELARTLKLTDVNIRNTRAESLAPGCFDVVTLRAVERFPSILPVAARLLARAGRLALLIGRAQFPQAQSTLPSLIWSAPIPTPASQSRVLAVAVRRPAAPGLDEPKK